MNESEIKLVRESFTLLAEQSEVVALIFYQRLFTTAPALQPLFGTDMETQAQRFMSGLRAIVALLEDSQQLQKLLVPLAARHQHYGVRAYHYENFGDALLWAFHKVLGRRFTPEMLHAWRAAYLLISRSMTQQMTSPSV